ncbi:MAG: DNA polymerase, partial [bacterium]|nr:DNA polymerase [bacterium]
MAVNMPVQGLAADIIKMAMIRIEREFDLERQDIKMILQVHDELVFEIKDDIIEEKAKKIKEIMENVLKLSAPIVVEIKAGKNWGEMKGLS